MKAFVINARGEAALREIPHPVPADGEALIKVRMAGICRTDQELMKGYMDFKGVPGHEFVGRVVEVNAKDYQGGLIGKRVVGEINCGCGVCSFCHSEMERHCPDRTVLGISSRNGAFAEYLTLPLKNLHAVHDHVIDDEAVFVEPIAAALEILEQVHIEPDKKVLVVGDGKLGMLIARILQIHGCDVFCAGKSEAKLGILKKWGIAILLNDKPFPGKYDIVVEASGSPDGFQIAVEALKPKGTLVLKSTYAGSLTLDATPLVINEIRVQGSRCGPFAPALRFIEQGLIATEDMIDEWYPFDEIEVALQHAAQPDAMKVLVNFKR